MTQSFHNHSPDRKQKVFGQGLNEYALTGGLVVIACIVSLSALGTNVSDMLGDTISKRETTLAAALNNLTTKNPLDNSSPDSAFGRTITVQLPNGESQQFSIPDPKAIIDTNGAGGVTKAYLAQLDQLIESYKKILPANDPRLAALEDLSRRGHLVADEQRKIETANDEEGYYANVDQLKFNTGRGDKSVVDFTKLDQCSTFTGGLGASIDTSGGGHSIDPCTGELSYGRRSLNGDSSRTLLQNFGVYAAEVRKQLQSDSFTGLLPLLDYFAGNIIQSGIATQRSAKTLSTGEMGTPNNPVILAGTQSRKERAKAAFTEVQANGLCGMSGFETCQRQNGQAIQSN